MSSVDSDRFKTEVAPLVNNVPPLYREVMTLALELAYHIGQSDAIREFREALEKRQ